jgi:moderate conductance mechanosensitive channel
MNFASILAAASDSDWISALRAQFDHFVPEFAALDPQQALIQTGLSFALVLGAGLVLAGLQMMLRALLAHVAPDADTRLARGARIGARSMRIARIIVFAIAFYLVLRLWGFDFSAFEQGPLGAVLRSAGRVALILAATMAAMEVSNISISRLFGRVAQRTSNGRRASQVRTLAPLLSGVATTGLVIVAAMMTLSEFGVEIGPLIAGAGIVGLAVGFGAQTLVKDFLTGIFLIVEDIVSIGDIAQVAGTSGVVEEMSLRTIKLRSFDGTLHAIPYGEAQVISNLTKNFSFAVFELSIAYSSDIATALEQMQQVGEQIRSDADFASMIFDPIEIVGVDKLADSGVILKARIKTLPGKQWSVGREYLRRIKLAFDAHGVEIPFPHLKLVAPDQPIPIASR